MIIVSIKTCSEKFLIFGLYFLLLTPLFFQQSLMNPLITFKTIVFQVVVELMAAVYLFLIIFYKDLRPRLNILSVSLLTLLTTLVLSMVFGVSASRSLWSMPERMTGVFLWLHLVSAFFIFSSLGKVINWQRYLGFSTIVSFFMALFPVVNLIFPNIFFDKVTTRLSGTLGNPIFLAIYLLFHVVIGSWLAWNFYKKGQKTGAGIFLAVAIFDLLVFFLTETRGALVALIIGLLFAAISYVYSSYKTNRTYKTYVTYGIAAAIIALVLFSIIFFFSKDLPFWSSVPGLSRFTGGALESVMPRFYAWRVAWQAFLERPVFGWGWENFYYAFNKYYEPSLLRWGFPETYFDKTHNVYLEFLSTTGLLGFLAYLWFLVVVFRKAKSLWLKTLLVIYYVHNFFAFDTLSGYLMFFVVLAFINHQAIGDSDTTVRASEASPSGGRGWLRSAALAALLLVAILPIYFFNWRLWLASHLEYLSINYWVYNQSKEGLEFLNAALAVPNPYAFYVKKDLAASIPEFYSQGKPIPGGQEQVRRAMTLLQEVVEENPLHYFFHLRFADAAIEIYSLDPTYLDLAEKVLAEAEKLSPKRQATFYVLSKIKNLKGDKEGALAVMKRAVDLDPKVGEPHFFYALLLFDKGRVPEGVEEIKLAAKLGRGPITADEARVIGGYLSDAGDYNLAISYFLKAIIFDPDDAEAKLKLGLTYYFAGNKDPAKRFIQEVMASFDLRQSPQYEVIQPILQDLGLENK